MENKIAPGDHVLVFGKYLARVLEYGYLGCIIKSLDGRLNKVDTYYKETDIRKITKFDKDCLQPFDRVLVRDNDNQNWNIEHFGYNRSDEDTDYIFVCSVPYKQCVPYNEDTQHLLGTDKDAPEFYKIW